MSWTAPAARAAVTVVTTNSSGALVLAGQFGDLDNDGRVTVLDIVRLNQHLSGTRLLSPSFASRADLNQDGLINERDREVLVDLILRRRASGADDWDGDGLANAEEIALGTNPFLADSDADGASDGLEIAEGTDPLDAKSRPEVIVMASPSLSVASWGPSERPMTVAAPSVHIIFNGGLEEASLTMAQPPLDVIFAGGAEQASLTMAQPPLEIRFPLSGVDEPIVLAQPSLEVVFAGGADEAPLTLAYPVVETVFPGGVDESPVNLALPPVEVHAGIP